MNEQVEFVTMSDREKYLFDLQGFLVVRGMLSTAEVETMNDALEANLDNRGNFGEANAISGNWEGRPLEGRFSPFRHYKGMLT